MSRSIVNHRDMLIPETVPRYRARAALTLQRSSPALWRAYQFACALGAIQPVDAPYLLEMLDTMRRVAPFTDGGARLVALFRLTRRVIREGVPGDVVECGVARGGTAALLAIAARHSGRHLWLYDSFEGLPPSGSLDGTAASGYTGTYRGSLDQVAATLARTGVDPLRVRMVKGWFDETLPSAEVRDIGLLHIDADWYQSVRTCLEALYDRVAPGGYVVLDDYGYWPGCQLATDEFLRERQPDARLVWVDAARRYFRKPR
jgi:O-methyltransferase